MRDSLQTICDRFIAGRDAVKQVFKLESTYIYPVCANIFCARGMSVSAEKLADCKSVIKAKTGPFSNYRGTVIAPVASMLAVSQSPERRMEQALHNYEVLKRHFFRTEFLALVAFLLTDIAPGGYVEHLAERGRAIYDRMKREHPFLTSSEDSVFAVLMAVSEKSDDALIADMEACYQLLKREKLAGSSNALQSVSHVLALSEGTPAEKCARVTALYDSIRAAGGKYGRYYELATLAALSLAEADIPQLTADMLEVDAFLAGQKGYGGLGFDKRTRMMHAAMIVSDEYAPQVNVETAAVTGTIAMIAAQQAAMCAMIASSSAASAN